MVPTQDIKVAAEKGSIPPFYLLPRKKNMKSSFLYNASPGSVDYANGSGWMTKEDFIKYMHHLIKHTNASKNNPLLLFLKIKEYIFLLKLFHHIGYNHWMLVCMNA